MMRNPVFRAAAIALVGSFALATLPAGADLAAAADMPGSGGNGQPRVQICGQAADDVILFDEKGRPTIPARTPYFYCVTGETLLPGQIPPPPEYCCR